MFVTCLDFELIERCRLTAKTLRAGIESNLGIRNFGFLSLFLPYCGYVVISQL